MQNVYCKAAHILVLSLVQPREVFERSDALRHTDVMLTVQT